MIIISATGDQIKMLRIADMRKFKLNLKNLYL